MSAADSCPVDHSKLQQGTSEKCPVDHTALSKTKPDHSTFETLKSGNSSEASACPVDHNSRKVWMGKTAEAESNEVCPVDHEAREIWMKNNASAPVLAEADCADAAAKLTPDAATPVIDERSAILSEQREVSSIPRKGLDGNWVYPSQRQFYNAMKRKNWSPRAEDMGTVVPIHNAVNERVWQMILDWEKGQGAEQCGGPELISFKGDSKKLTPRARWNMFWGYEKPFDRHDWKLDRCGKEIDYVIDFYAGKSNSKMPGIPSFYLDVRPKLNSVEGVTMRVKKFLGLY